MDVCVRLLGRFEITCDGDVAIDAAWKPAKAAAIVKILALREGRSMLREQLIAALWPEADAEAGANSLYKNLHQLRKTVRRAGGPRDVIHLDHPLIALAPYVQVDLDDFRRRAAGIGTTASVEELESAVALAGMLLPDDIYEPWTEPHRGNVHMQITRLRLQLARMYLEAQSFERAIEQYEAVLRLDELCDEAHHGLMRAYMGSDRRDLALRQYERYRALLASELGTAPSAETEALIAEIRRESSKSRAAEAVDGAVRDADEAMRRRAYGDALRLYRQAIEGLHAATDDPRRESELWLKAARATSAIGTQAEIAECCLRAAHLAEHAGEYRLLADALVQFQDATDSMPANHSGHREASERIEAALERLPADADAARALLLAAGARPVAAASRTENEQYVTGRLSIAGEQDAQIIARLREAVALARRSGDRNVLAYALTRLRVYITSPDTLDERLELTREMIEVTSRGRHVINQYQAQLFRHEDLLEAGDIDGARIQARAMRRLGEEIESSGILAVAYSLQATHDTADGPLAEARLTLRRSQEQDSKQGETSNSQGRLGGQLLALRWHEGRIGEMEPAFRRAVDIFPRVLNARAALAFIYAESGELEKARAEFERVTQQLESISKDYSWWFIVVFLSHVAIALGESDVARSLYAMMLPYAGRNASNAGAISFGSAELHLALLAEFLGNQAAAEGHFEKALAFNNRTRQRVWAARTRFHYAELLLRRGAEGDGEQARELIRIARADASELGMVELARQLDALGEIAVG